MYPRLIHTLTLKDSENTAVFCNYKNFFLRATMKLVGLHNFNLLFKRFFSPLFTHAVELLSH